MDGARRISRRRFLRRSAAAAGGLSAYMFLPRGVLSAPGHMAPSERVTIGFIGAGGRGRLLMKQIPPAGEIVAICDCYLPRCEQALRENHARWKAYQDYRRLLDAFGIDAVIVPTPDHGRVLPCIHACQAGKDIYAEKPLTLTIAEGRVLVKAVRKYGRVFQTGSQQRSMEFNRFACDFVRRGGIGRLHTVLGCNYTGPRTGDRPAQPIPEGLDWDMWLSQAHDRPYNRDYQFGWMAFRDFSGGEMTNWGAHGLDQVQWALGADGSGPVEIWPVTPGPDGAVSMRYAGGVLVKLELKPGPLGGAVFIGDAGKVVIDRNRFQIDPPELTKEVPPPEAAKVWEGPGWLATLHIQNWLDSIKTRRRPVADVEIGYRSITVCHLANIARRVGRKLRWDPAREIFPGDEEANAYLDRPKRKPYRLPDVL